MTRTTLSVDKEFTPGPSVNMVSRNLMLQTGESRHLRARLEATSSTTAIVGMTVRIRCFDSSGTPAGIVSASGRNHEGYDTSTYAKPGHLPIYADLLFTAPVAGGYTCGLFGSTYASSATDYSLTAVAGGTWLESSDRNQKGAGWWQNPACESDDRGGLCTYVGQGAANPDAFVFYNDGSPSRRWTADAAAASVDVLANIELTTCPVGTASCAAAMYDFPRGVGSVVDLRLQFIQLDTTGHTCRTHEQYVRKTITDDAHHSVANLAIAGIDIASTCGTRAFLMRIHVRHVEGQTVKIDGVQGGATSLTNGIAINRYS
ncbi:hypothetical protein [Streptomyces antibioticus]|uniref:hypothetical protein n=1 Tax=Streptomyces antibioticus TaxID=1890 RepID=UPI0033A47162